VIEFTRVEKAMLAIGISLFGAAVLLTALVH
jgi:hypothetical protein